MKKSIRIIGGMLAVTTTLLTLASCKASPSGKDDDDTFGGNGGKTVVRYYSFNDEQSNKELKAAIEADFYKKNPDIKIQLEISTGNFYSNLLNDISGKNEADVFGMEPGEIYPFLSKNYLESLDDYFAASENISLDDIWDINKQAYTYDAATDTFGKGKTYAVMKDWTTDSMLLYNRDLFSQEQLAAIEKDSDGDGIADPLTFEQFQKLCNELLVKKNGTITQYSFLPGLAEAKVLAQFLTNAGTSWFNSSTYESTFLQQNVKDVVKYYYDILAKNEVNNTGASMLPLFAQGKVAMIMSGMYAVEYYGLDKLNLGVAYPPAKAGCESKPYTTGCVGMAISARSKVKKAAFKFVEWYLDYMGEKSAERALNFPALKKYAEEYILNPEKNTNAVRLAAAQKFYKSLDKAVVIDRNKYCSQASLESIEFMYTGEYLEGAMTFDEFCETLDYEVNKRVRLAKQS